MNISVRTGFALPKPAAKDSPVNSLSFKMQEHIGIKEFQIVIPFRFLNKIIRFLNTF